MLSILCQARKILGLCLGKGWSAFLKPWVIKGICRKEHEKTQMVHPPWEELPPEIWASILQRLLLVDRIRASIVCKQWYCEALKQTPPQPIWILLPPNWRHRIVQCVGNIGISFFDLGEGTIGKLNFPTSLRGATPFGGSKGWLVFTKSHKHSLQVFLLDPISGVQISLPPFRSASKSIYLYSIQISSHDASEFVVAATFEENKILALCRPQDESWTVFEGLGVAGNLRYQCILFCRGILYAMVATENEEDDPLPFQTHSLKLAGDLIVTLKLIPEEADILGEYWDYIPHMVESNGELLIVLKILGANDDDDDDEDDDEPQLHWVETLQVFKVEASDDALSIMRLSNIDDDQTLFIDGVDSLSLPGKNFGKNCIYFLEQFLTVTEGTFSLESGVFHLKDGRIEPFLPSLDLPKPRKGSRNVWFFPNIGGFN